MSEKKKNNAIFLKIVVGVVIAAILYIAMMLIETSILKNYEKKTAVITTKEILSGTVIDESNVNTYFTQYETDAKLVPDNAVTKKTDMIGTVIENNMYANQIVSTNDYVMENSILADMKTPTEVTIPVTALSNAVAGRLRGGSMIDISVLDSATKECTYALENVYLKKAMTSDGTEIKRDDTKSVATVFNIIIDKSEVNEFIAKVNSGTVVITDPNAKADEVNTIQGTNTTTTTEDTTATE